MRRRGMRARSSQGWQMSAGQSLAVAGGWGFSLPDATYAGVSGSAFLDRQLQTERIEDRCERLQGGIAVFGKGAVKRLPAQPRLACDLAHTFRTGDIAKRTGNVLGVVSFHRRLEI